jgi:hypothetical protein
VTLLVTVAALLTPHPATHDRADCPRPLERAYSRHYRQVARRHGTRAPGRNIRRYGVQFHGTVFDAVCSELRRSDRQLRRLLTAPAYPTLERRAVQPAQPPAGIRSTGIAAGGTLAAIARCESGGNYHAVSPSGQYRGAFQFDYRTWASVGGRGDPAAASPAEQDQRAAKLYAQQGASPWPVCGR